MIGLTSLGINYISHLESFLGNETVFFRYINNEKLKAIAGWGRKTSFYRAQNYSKKHNIPLITLEDGFIRSIGLGVQGYQPLSLVIDDQGIYFDAYQISTLENLIHIGQEDQGRALLAIEKIRHYQISKYNHAPELALNIPLGKKQILIADQTFGDQSIKFSGASEQSFVQMLQQAKSDYPEAVIWLKVHPDVISGKKQGHFNINQLRDDPQIQIIAQNCNPIALLKQMDEVYVVSSQMGFEALMLGKTVHCFGLPWYAGWGLTNDDFAPTGILQGRRQVKRSLTQLFSAAYFQYARYVNPNTGKRCELEEILELLILQKSWANQLSGNVNALGFSRWKRNFIQSYLSQPTNRIFFKWWYPKQALSDQHYIIWGNKKPQQRQQLEQNRHAKVWRMEDGFIRSIGLGANLIRPLSLVLDDQGIYYDPNQPSRLETILNNIQLLPEQQQRAQQLRFKIVSQHLSKYNIGEKESWPDIPNDKTVILVPGQVEDDASVQLGGCGIFTNLELLKVVRTNKPNAWIIYKPHPDVEAGLRPGKIVNETLYKYANSVIYKMDMPSCLNKVDEIHTISSLTGFEALLRQKKVYCYGLPFYAGWGLTEDRTRCERRKKRLTLDELIYGTLVSYPLYKLPDDDNAYLATPEHVIDYIVKQRQMNAGLSLMQKKSWLARLRALLIYKR
ncbi:capsular polysaccharide biosynthesis protein [Alkanindiges illinoisensis]|uniref:capsular polysaccharide biosynthesis protein n=1 Tax=Alkanindiges illinoisensis TaxID=197183 RepID=UPI00047D17B9|nr:capsular polysaccharide biosynthesis protein [Alkanindiges illinoisensis]